MQTGSAVGAKTENNAVARVAGVSSSDQGMAKVEAARLLPEPGATTASNAAIRKVAAISPAHNASMNGDS